MSGRDDPKIDARAGELAALRKKAGNTYDRDQKRAILEIIAAHSLDWWADLVLASKTKGTGAARDSYREATTEIIRLTEIERMNTGTGSLSITVNGIDIGELRFSPPADTNGNGPAGS